MKKTYTKTPTQPKKQQTKKNHKKVYCKASLYSQCGKLGGRSSQLKRKPL